MSTSSLLSTAVRDLGKGKIDTTQKTIAMYEKVMGDAIRSNLSVTRDIAFGAHEQQLLDVYAPTNRDSVAHTKPVVVFFHQGGFVAGGKGALETVVVGKFFSHRGIVCVLANYRLAPEGAWPAAAEDVAAASGWVRQNIGAFGGDPDRMVLFGLSSGATHVASHALHKSFADGVSLPYRGLILASGRYLLPPEDPDPNLFHNFGRPKIGAYYGTDPLQWRERQIIGNVAATKLPIFLIVAELDNHMFEVNTIDLLKELTDKTGQMPRFLQVHGHNHVSHFLNLGAADDPFGHDLLDFIQRVTANGTGQ